MVFFLDAVTFLERGYHSKVQENGDAVYFRLLNSLFIYSCVRSDEFVISAVLEAST